jgi:hydrogenase maturation protease
MRENGLLVIGVGNAWRGDDGAGLIAVRRLREKASSSVRVVEHDGEGTSLMELWKKTDNVIIIDAMMPRGAPGAIHRFDAIEGPFSRDGFRHSTHAFGVGEGIELARALGLLPESLIVYGIEGVDFKMGKSLSSEVEKQIDEWIVRLSQEIH